MHNGGEEPERRRRDKSVDEIVEMDEREREDIYTPEIKYICQWV